LNIVNADRILVWGIGCALLCDQGFGIHVVQALESTYAFDSRVELIDGGLVGVGMVGLLCNAQRLIAIDAVRDNGRPGDFYRWEDEGVFERFKGRNHPQQVEFLEALAHTRALDQYPRAVLLGVEPDDTQRLSCEMTPCLKAAQPAMMDLVLAELDRCGVTYHPKKADPHVSCHTLQDHRH
jgi:hydrogenase maturation protease